MSARSAIVDGDRAFADMRYFVASAQACGHARRDGIVEVKDAHYGGPLTDCTVYMVVPTQWPRRRRSLESVRALFGSDALSGIESIFPRSEPS